MNVMILQVLALGGCVTEPVECSELEKITVYADEDKDTFGNPDTAKTVCPPVDAAGIPTGEIPRGFAANDDDCDDLRADINPDQIELCDGQDNDCDTQADEGLRELLFFLDGDGDTFGNPELDLSTTACNAPPGFVDNNLDCDDENSTIRPDAIEVCDYGVDNDCDGRADDQDFSTDPASATSWHVDADGDGAGDPAEFQLACEIPDVEGWVGNADDCDDTSDRIGPTVAEICNRIDDDCDQLIDDSDSDLDPASQSTWFADADNDGFGDPGATVQACFQPWFHVTNDDDCDDAEPLLGLPAGWQLDGDSDGYGAGAVSANSCTPPTPDHELAVLPDDCNDTNPFVNPLGNEVCDGRDNDCDGRTDDEDEVDPAFANVFYQDQDGDGFGTPASSVERCSAPPGFVVDDTDCDDSPGAGAAAFPGAPEVCDGLDNDCDLLVDDDDQVDPATTQDWFFDQDLDGFGNPAIQAVQACSQPNEYYVDNDLDCDDADADQGANLPWFPDSDGDGVGVRTGAVGAQCARPGAGFVSAYFGEDCAPNNPARFPGNEEICGNGVDEDCDAVDPVCFQPGEEPSVQVRALELDLGDRVDPFGARVDGR